MADVQHSLQLKKKKKNEIRLQHSVVLGGEDGHNVRLRLAGSLLAGGVVSEHDLHGETKHSLTHVHGTGALRDELVGHVSRELHVSVLELHGLGTLSTHLTCDGQFHTLGLGLHHELHHSVARTTHGKSSDKLVTEGLSLGDGGQTTVGDTLGVQLHSTLGEAETLLHDRGQLTDATATLSKHVLGACGLDDDLSALGGHANL